MAAVDPTGPLVLNAATVPRVLKHPPSPHKLVGKSDTHQEQQQQRQQQEKQEQERRREEEAAGVQRTWRHFLGKPQRMACS